MCDQPNRNGKSKLGNLDMDGVQGSALYVVLCCVGYGSCPRSLSMLAEKALLAIIQWEELRIIACEVEGVSFVLGYSEDRCC